MSNKDKGARREREARDLLIEEGYIVQKAGGSLGMFDLIATPCDENCVRDGLGNYLMRYVQCKSNHWPGPSERGVMEGVGILCHHAREIWRCDDRQGWRVLVLLPTGWHLVCGMVAGTMAFRRQNGRSAR